MEEALSLREARARYFEANGFGADGGYGRRWVKLELGRLPLVIPNTAARVRAVARHDLHHVLTGYATTATGEAEIGAWEIASGCGRFTAAWVLNLWALAYGAIIAPGAVWRAFLRGRRSRNLYRAGREVQWESGGAKEALALSVAEMRRRLGIPAAGVPVPARVADALAFGAWLAVAWAWGLGSLALLLAPAVVAAKALM